jgi:hypothetical protein
MRKVKVITLGLTVIMLAAMIGIAAAETIVTLNPDPVSSHQGDTVVVSVNVANTAIEGLTYGLSCTPFYKEDGYTVEGTITGTLADSTLYVASGSSATTTLTISTQSGTPDGQYTYFVEASDGYLNYQKQGGYAVGTLNMIPEFTTIAIPVAAILGLFVFFNYRKRR